MNIKPTEKDKIILKDVGMAGIEILISRLGLDIPWKLSKALFGSGMKLREKRVFEWVEMIKDNPSVFTEEILSSETFQDGFVVALEKYLTERSEEKRKVFRNIFLGFARANDKAGFPLEKFTHTLTQMGEVDIEVLRDVKIDENGQNYQIYGNTPDKIDNIYGLVGLGLLLNTTGTRMGFDGRNSPFVKFSPFGREFVEYLKK